MEQLLIEVGSEDTAEAIKEFVGRFADASICVQTDIENSSFYEETYGMSKDDFEAQLNIGLAQSVLGMTKPWDEVKAELLARIFNRVFKIN